MMHFALMVNGQEITKFSVHNVGEDPTEDATGYFVYDFTGWRPDPVDERRISRYVTGQLSHRRENGIEELAIKVLSEYQRLLRAHGDVMP